jgi:pimeloyl-ACP methyl ester carboxylesterase
MQGIRQLTNEGPTPKEVLDSGIRVAFLAGERDAVISPTTITAAHELLPGSILKVVAGAPHSMYWESADVYNAEISSLADQLLAAN